MILPQAQVHGCSELGLMLFITFFRILSFKLYIVKWSPLGQPSMCLKRRDKCHLGVCHSLAPPHICSSDTPWAQKSGGSSMHGNSSRHKVSTKKECPIYDWVSRGTDSLQRPCSPFKSELDSTAEMAKAGNCSKKHEWPRNPIYPVFLVLPPHISQPLILKMMI